MCLIAVAWQAHPRWRLLLAGNRDEQYARPSAPLARWADLPVIAGRDLQAGGTWLGVTDGGRVSVVTNVRDPRDPQRGASRGLLVSDFLAGHDDAAAHAQALSAKAAGYRPFNLLTFDARAGYYLGNRPAACMQAVTPGVHALSNAAFDTPWPKTCALSACVEAWIKAGSDDFSPLFAALADERPAPDAALPDTGIGIELERKLSPAFIRAETYGTRASTVVAIDHAGAGIIIERRFGPRGMPLGETALRFRPAG